MTPLLLSSLLMQSAFLTEPYLQLGNHPMPAAAERLRLGTRPNTPVAEHALVVWHAADQEAAWKVEVRGQNADWREAARLETRRVAVRGLAPFRIYEAELDNLQPGAAFDYRISLAGREVFQATGKARGRSDARTRFALLGDTGQGTSEEQKVAAGVWKANPDAVLLAGDLVYEKGRVSEYFKNFFPVFNSASTPLLRSRLTLPAPGNHDLEESWNLGATPDGLAYFHFWNAPRNGPKETTVPLEGPAADQTAFKLAAGDRFPGIANYSFDWGPIHWTVLDSSAHVDWTRPELRQWLINDLQSSGGAWRFVMFHHAPFHSSRKHAEQQRMRLLHDIFEKYDVLAVFSGHVHNYQRTHRIRFQPKQKAYGKDQRVPGTVAKHPDGVTYFVSGAGGAGLHDKNFTGKPKEWQDFTAVFEAAQHSFTLIDAEPHRVEIRQIGVDGRELDRFELTR